MSEKWTIFGERLKAELDRQGMSLRQFSDKTGITLTTACRYAHSQRTPRATEILKAAKVLGVTCDYMLGLSDDPHKTRDGWAKAGFHDLPSAQPEIIRCKDCKLHGTNGHRLNCAMFCCTMPDDGFCSCGERREDG